MQANFNRFRRQSISIDKQNLITKFLHQLNLTAINLCKVKGQVMGRMDPVSSVQFVVLRRLFKKITSVSSVPKRMEVRQQR